MSSLLNGTKRLRELDGGTMQRLTALSATLLVLSLSVVAFMNNGIRGTIDPPLRALLGLGADAVIALFLITAVLGAFHEKGLQWSLAVAWILYLPSVLYFSKIDWLYIMGTGSNLSTLKSDLPEVYIVLNGAALVGTSLLIYSYGELRELRRDLLGRGGSAPEVDAACARNMLFLTGTIAISAASAVAIWGAMVLTSSLGEDLLGSAYLWTTLAGMAALLAIFWAMMGKNVMSGKEKAGGP